MTMGRNRSFVIALVMSFLLYLSGFFIFFTPLPLAYYTKKHGVRFGGILSGVSLGVLAVIYLLFGMTGWSFLRLPGTELVDLYGFNEVLLSAVSYFIYYMVIGWGMVIASGKKWPLNAIFLKISTAVAVLGLIYSALAYILLNVNILVESHSYLLYIIGLVIEQGVKSGLTSDQLFFLNNNKELLAGKLAMVVPSFWVVWTFAVTWISIVFLKRRLRGVRFFDYLKPLSEWKAPEGLVWVLIGAGALYFANLYFLKFTPSEAVLINVVIILAVIYFFQGLAVAVSLLGSVKSKWLKLSGYLAMVLFFQAAMVLMVLAGIFDFWVDFRKFAKR